MEEEVANPGWIISELLPKAKSEAVLVLGAGITGKAIAKKFLAAGASVVLLDEREIAESVKRDFPGAEFIDSFMPSAESSKRLFEKEFAFAVASPGISPRGQLVSAVSGAGISILSELDLAFSFIGYPQITVTGTNGKTTTVNLIHQMLLCEFPEAKMVGNVGTPCIGLIDPQQLKKVIAGEELELEPRVLVAELSSYQLEWLQFSWQYVGSRQVSICLNLTSDHLERHGSMEAYAQAKGKMFVMQRAEDVAVLSVNDPGADMLAQYVVSENLLPIGKGELNPGCSFDLSTNTISIKTSKNKENYSLDSYSLLGAHNKLNLCAAVAAARVIGVSFEAIQMTIDKVKPVRHRLEIVSIKDNVTFINDSKATNVSSTIAALSGVGEKFESRQIILLLGGRAKEGGFEELKRVTKSLKKVICFGEARDAIAKVIKGKKVETLSEALLEAKKITTPGDLILFSPGCASFDAYKNFEERGEHFCELVN